MDKIKRYASIDMGTNTLRLLIAEKRGTGRLKPLLYRRAVTRLGGNYSEKTGIDRGAAERTIRALEGFKGDISNSGVDLVRAAATSVVRRAANREWFLGGVKKRTGIEVRVLTGPEEARLSLLGVLSVLRETPGRGLVIDIGGGSTEFIASKDGRLRGAWSMEMGVVHLTEDHLKTDPPDKAELKAMEAEIGGVIGELKGLMTGSGIDPAEYYAGGGAKLVGTAGTITTLAALDQDLNVYDRALINNYTLTRERALYFYKYLSGLRLRERERILPLEKGREDLIIPGAAITLQTMDTFGFTEMTVSDAGLLEGLMLDIKTC